MLVKLSIVFYIIVSLFAQFNRVPITPSKGNTDSPVSYYGYIYQLGSSSPKSDIKEKTIVKNYAELEKYCNNYYLDENKKLDELKSKYTEDYFSSKSLAIIFIPLSNPSENVELISATKEDSNVKINYKINSAPSDKEYLTVMAYCLLIVEIPNNITGISIS